MPSIQSRLINFTLRNRHLLRLRLKRDRWDWNTSIPEFRRQCEQAAQKTPLPDGITVAPAAINVLPEGLKAEWILPCSGAPAQAMLDEIHNQPVLFYLIGGGYVSGTCTDHRSFVAKFVAGTGIAAFVYEYRLAPEHPYPAALEDTLAAYRWILDQGFNPDNIVFTGESAGGGLCLAALLALRDLGIPLPAAGVAISPWTDVKMTGDSYKTKRKACISPIDMNTVCAKYYAGDQDPTLAWMSPLYGDLRGLPPLCIYVGDDETQRDDSIRFAQKAKAAGVEVTLNVGEGMVHCYPLFAPLFPEAVQAMAEICAFIQTHARVAESSVP